MPPSLLHPASLPDFAKLTASPRLSVVDFWATWCGPCKAIAPNFEALPSKFPNAQFIKVDVDEQQEIASECGIRAMPTIQAYIKGQKVGEVVGADWNAIQALVEKHYKAGDAWGGSGHRLGGGDDSATTGTSSAASTGGLLSGISSYIWGSGVNTSMSEDEALQAAIAASLDSSEPAPEKKPRSGKSTEIQFRLPDGTTVRGTFDTNDTILDLRKFLVEQKKELRGRKLVIANTFPKKEFGDSTLHNTLDQEKLVGRVQLAVLLK